MSLEKLYIDIAYEDTYIEPLLIAALRARLPSDLLVFLHHQQQHTSQLTASKPDTTTSAHVSAGPSLPSLPEAAKILHYRQYETLPFPALLAHPQTRQANSYVVRRALIRKHYLSATIRHWVAKHPDSALAKGWPGGCELEVDYAEFLDEALAEAWELRESWAKNGKEGENGRAWWILKPGMSERGEGLRLFSSEEELREIFEEWDPPDDEEEKAEEAEGEGIMTTHLRHFLAQPYIHPPLLLPSPFPAAGRKFHLRVYVLAVGALKVYVSRSAVLALFAAEPYHAPSSSPNNLAPHLTNTCFQQSSTGKEREGDRIVYSFWDLPPTLSTLAQGDDIDWRDSIFTQICALTSEVFTAAARGMGPHFQPFANAFEVFGLDFVVGADGRVWLLEVNAFPDFAQTGKELKGLVEGVLEGVVERAVRPFFFPDLAMWKAEKGDGMVEVLDLELGRR
ncbi:hypothetical protein M433DRAFT_736 [Acidomyces richmondensis BFW]|nr:MAG: hypothetical protein FE78DRAFT_31527 [Acidomyces sp. 'richmondensis']KYG49856.1 hypothetical protein M433DRAFT_736 [Acidomyces richmondensis BFW]